MQSENFKVLRETVKTLRARVTVDPDGIAVPVTLRELEFLLASYDAHRAQRPTSGRPGEEN